MALIRCPECKRRISDKAISCPLCGFPLAENTEIPKQNKTNGKSFRIKIKEISMKDIKHRIGDWTEKTFDKIAGIPIIGMFLAWILVMLVSLSVLIPFCAILFCIINYLPPTIAFILMWFFCGFIMYLSGYKWGNKKRYFWIYVIFTIIIIVLYFKHF